MFKREDTVRVAAANAIVELIITENVYMKNDNSSEESSNQPSSSQHPETHLEFGGGLFHELSGLLRRCFSQQVPTFAYLSYPCKCFCSQISSKTFGFQHG
jgi:fanconi anemia group I protein